MDSPVTNFGAGNETRTRDPNLGKVMLYQLSYSRNRPIFYLEKSSCQLLSSPKLTHHPHIFAFKLKNMPSQSRIGLDEIIKMRVILNVIHQNQTAGFE